MKEDPMPKRKKSGYILVPIKDDDGKNIKPDLFNSWALPLDFSRTCKHILVYRSRYGAEKDRRRIFNRTERKAFKVIEISMTED